jgi:hypothetical protein
MGALTVIGTCEAYVGHVKENLSSRESRRIRPRWELEGRARSASWGALFRLDQPKGSFRPKDFFPLPISSPARSYPVLQPSVIC